MRLSGVIKCERNFWMDKYKSEVKDRIWSSILYIHFKSTKNAQQFWNSNPDRVSEQYIIYFQVI